MIDRTAPSACLSRARRACRCPARRRPRPPDGAALGQALRWGVRQTRREAGQVGHAYQLALILIRAGGALAPPAAADIPKPLILPGLDLLRVFWHLQAAGGGQLGGTEYRL
jgi:hypothetical protein